MIKRAVKTLLPIAAYNVASSCRHSYKQWSWIAQTWLKRGLPETVLHFGLGPGDDLLCTVVLRELKKRGQKKIWMMSKNPELFEKNGDVDQVVPIDDRLWGYVTRFKKKWQHLEYSRFDPEKDMSAPPEQHIIAELCRRAGIQGEIALHPYFHLEEEERARASWASDMVAVQSSGLAGKWPMQNKQWFSERFQEVVNRLKDDFKLVQLGSASDPALAGAVDLRGKTNMRETAAVLANCRLYLGNVGFLMHLARSVECPSVILFGGREAPWQSGYSCNINLYSAVPCAPCWLWNKCDHNRLCMDKITASEVVDAVGQISSRARGSLIVDTLMI
jgi:ADP-heptose:LPS heptosyltransferase